METLKPLMTDLWYLDTLCLVVLLLRLAYLRFYKQYPALTMYLATDVLCSAVGLSCGTRSQAYYWTDFLSSSVLGVVLLIWMCHEMFGELYYCHQGLRGATQCTLKRSVMISSAVTLGLAPVALIHWHDADFQCWEFPVSEVSRCLDFGVVIFVLAMWSMLRWLPLDIPKNVKAYSYSICVYLACVGVLETVVLIAHNHFVTLICSIVLLVANLVFHCTLAVFAQRPAEILPECHPYVGPDLIAHLTSVSNFFERVDEAQQRGRASALNRIPFFAIARSLNVGALRATILRAAAETWRRVANRGGTLKSS
jgi:hypothetical protein